MLQIILSNPIVAFVILVGLVVFFHEFGHFIVGRLLGVDVEEFSIGFGPRAFGFKRGMTDYKVCWLPLGGYVRFYGADGGGDIPLARRESSILTAKLYKRALISAAGPAANFVLSFIIMVVLSAWGMPQPAARVAVLPGKVAELGGMLSGDLVVAVGKAPVSSWKELTDAVSKNPGQELEFEVERPGVRERVFLQLVPEEENIESAFGDKQKVGRIGVAQFFPMPQVVRMNDGLADAMGFQTGDKILSISGPERSKEIIYLHEFFGELDYFWNVSGPNELANKILETSVPLPKIFVERESVKLALEPSEEAMRAWANRYAERNKEPNSGLNPKSWGWNSVFLTTDLLVKGFRAEAPLPQELAACGIGPGTALRGSVDGAVFSSPVDLSLFLQGLTAEVSAVPSSEVSTETMSNLQKNVKARFQLVRPDGVLVEAECQLAFQNKRDHLNRMRAELLFPVEFASNGLPTEQVTIKSSTLVGALGDGAQALGEQASTIFVGLKKLVSGSIPLANLGGPIQIARVAGNAAEGGLLIFFLTVSWMSVNIGMFNLLPLPALDGGTLLMQGVEAAYGKPLPERVQAIVQRMGIVMILCLVVLVFYNDILRMLGG